MAFINSCYIKSTDIKLIEYLVEIGYKEVKSVSKSKDKKKYIYCCGNKVSVEPLSYILKNKYSYYCGDAKNKLLFLGIASINDSTDIMQWFYVNKENPTSFVMCYNEKNIDTNLSKASMNDLINYFYKQKNK